MSTEKQLREIAATAIREHLTDEPLNAIFEDVCCEQSLDSEHPDAQRIYDLLRTWPIIDLPVPDGRGYLFPKSGLNYGNVHTGIIRHPEKGPIRCIRISRGLHPINLTREEALELAAILTAAAMEEA